MKECASMFFSGMKGAPGPTRRHHFDRFSGGVSVAFGNSSFAKGGTVSIEVGITAARLPNFDRASQILASILALVFAMFFSDIRCASTIATILRIRPKMKQTALTAPNNWITGY